MAATRSGRRRPAGFTPLARRGSPSGGVGSDPSACCRAFVAPAVTFVETVAEQGGLEGFSYLWTRAEHILAASVHHMPHDKGARCQFAGPLFGPGKPRSYA